MSPSYRSRLSNPTPPAAALPSSKALKLVHPEHLRRLEHSRLKARGWAANWSRTWLDRIKFVDPTERPKGHLSAERESEICPRQSHWRLF